MKSLLTQLSPHALPSVHQVSQRDGAGERTGAAGVLRSYMYVSHAPPRLFAPSRVSGVSQLKSLLTQLSPHALPLVHQVLQRGGAGKRTGAACADERRTRWGGDGRW